MQVSTTQMDVICNDSRIALVLSPEGTSQDRKVLFQAQGGGSHLEGDILSNKLSYPRAKKDLAQHQEPCSSGPGSGRWPCNTQSSLHLQTQVSVVAIPCLCVWLFAFSRFLV